MPRPPPAAASACSSPAWFCTRALGLRLSTSCAATVHPRCCAADTAASQPPAGHCVNARSTVAPEFARTCAQGRTNWGTSSSCRSSARPGTLAAARVPRGWSAEANRPANRPAIPPRAVGLFGRALSRLTGMAHWARGPKARALGGVAERTCAAIRAASVLVNSRLPCRVVYVCSLKWGPGVRWKCLPTGYDRSVFLRHPFIHMLYGLRKLPTIITKKADARTAESS